MPKRAVDEMLIPELAPPRVYVTRRGWPGDGRPRLEREMAESTEKYAELLSMLLLRAHIKCLLQQFRLSGNINAIRMTYK